MNDIFGVVMRRDVRRIEFMQVTIVIYDQNHKSRPPTSWGLYLAVPMQTYVYIRFLFFTFLCTYSSIAMTST